MQHSPYRILGKIGQGQFGQVYCAVNRQTGEIVALKDLDPQRFPTNKFLRELSYLISLRHRNIVSCHGIAHHLKGRYLVMDYCSGGTLRDLMESESPLKLSDRLKLVADILLGLEQAHQHQIVHCDIKPENILLRLDSDGWTACISDFGIARFSQENATAKKEGGYTGSPAYMAPERFYGKHSYESDLYSVGIILYELILGKRPFSGTPLELQSAHLNQRVVLPETMPFILRSLLSKSLEKLPQKRFSSAKEMLTALELAMQVLLTEEPPKQVVALPPPLWTSQDFTILREESLSFPIGHLAVYGDRVYRGIVNQLLCQVYTNPQLTGEPSQEWQLKFNAPLTKIVALPQGCLAIAHAASQYLFYEFPQGQVPTRLLDYRLLNLPAKKLVSAIDPQGYWLAIASQTKLTNPSAYFQVLNLLQNNSPRSPVAFPLPSQLIVLDRRHGLATFSLSKTSEKQTIFHLINRRGQLIKGFSLPLALQSITPNLAFPYRLIAIEQSNSRLGVSINLKPLKVTRLSLDISPTFVVSYPWGYLLADRQGKIILLSVDGERIQGVDLSVSLTAIAPFGETGILLATWSESQGILYTLDLEPILKQVKN